MSLAIRSFTEFIIKKINEEGVRSSGWSEEEIRSDVVDMIWEAYEEWEKD